MDNHYFVQNIQDSSSSKKILWITQSNILDIISNKNTIISNKLFLASSFQKFYNQEAYTKNTEINFDLNFKSSTFINNDTGSVINITCIPCLITSDTSKITLYIIKTIDIINNWQQLNKSFFFSKIMHNFLIRYSMTQTFDNIDVLSEHLNILRTELNSLTVNYIYHPMIPQPSTSILKIPLLKYQRANIKWMDNIESNPPKFIFSNRKYYLIGKQQNNQNLYYLRESMNFVTETSTHYFDRKYPDPSKAIDKYEVKLDLPKITVKGGIIMDDPGLGKTVQLLYKALIQPEDSQSLAGIIYKPTLVIVPDHLITHWKDEIMKFFVDISGIIIIDNYIMLKNPEIYSNKVILISVSTITTYAESIIGKITYYEGNFKPSYIDITHDDCKSFVKKFYSTEESIYMNFSRIIIDEIHELYISVDSTNKIRNPALLTLLQLIKSDYRWGCTATPFVSNLAIYHLMGFLCPADLQLYDKVICQYRYLYDIYKNIMRRNTKKSIIQEYNFPEIHRTVYQFELTPVEKMVYSTELKGNNDLNTLRKTLCALVVNGSGSGTTSEIFSNLNQLKDAIKSKYNKIYKQNEKILFDFVCENYLKGTDIGILTCQINGQSERVDIIDKIFNELNELNKLKYLDYISIGKLKEFTNIYNLFYKTRSTYNYMNSKLVELDKIIDYNDKIKEDQIDTDDSDVSNCCVCMSPVSRSLVVMPCCHIICYECFVEIKSKNPSFKKCPECNQKCEDTDIKILSKINKNQKNIDEFIQSYGTKMGNLIYYLKQLKNKEKIIIYTQWNDVIEKIYNVIIQSSINIAVFTPVKNPDTAISDFKQYILKSSILILSSETKTAGINLIEADSIILYEPIAGELGKRKELKTQIIGRCHRIGRKLPVRVIEFVVMDTIEEKLFNEEQQIQIDPNEFMNTDYTLSQLYQNSDDFEI